MIESAPLPRTRYSRVAIALHWLIALAIIFNLSSGLLDRYMPVHKATGITILVLSLFRLYWRLAHRPPPPEPTLARWEIAVATVTHWTFYVLMIAMPVTGWLMTSAGGRKFPLSWYGLFDVPYLPVARDKGLAAAMGGAHETLGYAMLALAALHIAAAMKHVFLDGDGTFARMLPGRD